MQKPFDYRQKKMKQKKHTPFASLICASLLLLPLSLLTGCATNSPPPVQPCPALPAIPSVDTAQPSQPYSTSARLKLEEWRAKLTATPLTR